MLNTIKQEDVENKLEFWHKKLKISSCVLAMDIGGSNMRMCFQVNKDVVFRLKFDKVNTYSKLVSVFEKLNQQVKNVFDNYPFIRFTCLAIAGPVHSVDLPENIVIPNYKKEGQLKTLETDLLFRSFSALFRRENCCVINDMVSSCYGLLECSDNGTMHHYFDDKDFFAVEGEKVKLLTKIEVKKSYFICNMGTGFGSAILKWQPDLLRHEVIPLELGHINMFFPTNKNDQKIYNEISKMNKYVIGKKCLEVEDIVSGSKGVTHLFNSLRNFFGDDFSSYNIDDNEIAYIVQHNEQMNIYQFKKLFFCAQQVCILFPFVKGVLFCGNNTAKNYPLISKKIYKNKIVNGFKVVENQKRVNWVPGKIEAYIQKRDDINFNLLGGLYCIKKLEKKLMKNEKKK